ncbi:hypothetical protein ACT4R9_05670 [Ornithobacterium rhinotracheale]|uniref:hypothetical protein n=1 Tax=Ornithobacterium rhinotracheale TaxID=28251 RepID=UPI001FF2F0C3|nr:hypothetical protein [Ornithobacterium rhinotracheale]MCK0199132.1 hypothetical protein [Ornithobacterium rhinotracheale]
MNIKELKKYLQKEIEKIENDNRFQCEKANVFINAPLALIQASLSSRHRTLLEIEKKMDELIK